MLTRSTFAKVALLLLFNLLEADSKESRILRDRSLVGDFNWDITPEDGYPAIAFADATESKEVVFKYNFTGTTGPNKFLTVQLLEKGCNGTADSASFVVAQNVSGNALEVDLDIVQQTITTSRQYSENPEGTQAEIDFCIRIDYNYLDSSTNETESINFHETSVTITVDLTANFTLDSISTNRTAATEDQANAALDYPVEAYYCQNDNSEVGSKPLTQGDILQFCVKMYDNVTADVFVEDIMEFTLSQPGGSAANSRPIVNKEADALTEKLCLEMGICNVKHQLSSKWFADPFPKSLRIDGVAILSFGKASAMPSAAPGNRRLRVPIRGLLSANEISAMMSRHTEARVDGSDEDNAAYQPVRQLQAASESPFDLQVSLLPVDRSEADKGSDSSMTTYLIIAVCAIALLVGCCILLCVFCINRKNKKKAIFEKEASFRTSSHVREPSFYSTSRTNVGATSCADSVSHTSLYTDTASRFTQGPASSYRAPNGIPEHQPCHGQPAYLHDVSLEDTTGAVPRDYLVEDFGAESAAGLSSVYSDATPWSYSSASPYGRGELID